MKGKRSTKNALISSVLVLALCVSMLIGATFAWFTDTASTSVNKIQAGSLDVALEMKDASGNWVSAEGQTLSWQKAAGHESEAVLWEPGCTYRLPELRVKNNGNLTLKYKMVVTGIDGDAELLDVIDFTYGTGIDIGAEVTLAPNAATEGIIIEGKMEETAGNEYQGKSIEGIGITVIATQKDAESDSIDNTYDQNALYPEAVVVLPAVEDQPLAQNGSNYTYTNPSGSVKVTVANTAAAGSPAVTVKPTTIPESSTVSADVNAEGRAAVAYEITMTGVTLSDTELATFDILVGKGLTNVTLYHSDAAMTRVNTMAELDAADEFYYNADTGYATFKVSHLSPFTAVYDTPTAAVGATGYYNLQDALNVGGEVVLLKDATLDSPVVIGAEVNVVLDLNGKEIIENGAGARRIQNRGTMTIRDGATGGGIRNTTVGNPGADGSYGLFDNYGTLTIENGTFTDVAHGNGSSFRNRSGANMTINGGSFISTADDSQKQTNGYTGAANAFVYSDGPLTINGGTFTMQNARYTPAIKVSPSSVATIQNATITTYKSGGIEVAGGDMTISNTNISVAETNSYYANAIAVSNDGVAEVISGNFVGYQYGAYIYTSGGTINISGGTFRAETALRADNDSAAPQNGSNINVSGGSFTGNYIIATGNAELNISGGTFNADPSAYVAEGYTATANNGTWTVAASAE